jgi:Zn-dependent peptidase ImmA (M78 family)
MTIGVNGFIGKRLTEARMARGIMKQSHLADLLENCSGSAIHSYENEINKPRPEMVTEIANFLRVKEDYFFTPFPTKTFPIFWRSSHATTAQKRAIAQARFSWTKIIDSYLKEFLVMPKLNLPPREELGVPDNIESLEDEEIEAITLRLREYWGLGTTPIHNMTTLLENNGIMLSYGELESKKLDAFSNKSEYDCSFHIFLGVDKGGALRSRMDAAHELGHLILHSHLSESEFLGQKHSVFEHQAFRFASAFLMPLPSFKDDVWMTSIEALKTLRSRWIVSVGAMMKRCEDIGLYGEKDTSRMWIKYRRNWQNIEDDSYEFEAPQLLRRSIDMIISEGLRTKSQILYDLPFRSSDVEKILNLPSGYFEEDFGRLKQFPQIRDEHKQRTFNEIEGKVIKGNFG